MINQTILNFIELGISLPLIVQMIIMAPMILTSVLFIEIITLCEICRYVSSYNLLVEFISNYHVASFIIIISLPVFFAYILQKNIKNFFVLHTAPIILCGLVFVTLSLVNIRDDFNQIKFTTGDIALSSIASLLILYLFLDLIFGEKINEYRLKKLIAELRKYNALTPEVIAEMNQTSQFFPRKDEEHVIQSLALIKLNYHGKINAKQVVGIIDLLRNESNYNAKLK